MPGRDPIRLTENRRAILEELRARHSHPTAEEVHRRVRARLPRISLATVYRSLDYLERHGLVDTVRDTEGRRRYDAAGDEHCHIQCEVCGRVADVRLTDKNCIELLVEESGGYEVTGHRLSFRGRCPECMRGSASALGGEAGGGWVVENETDEV